MKLAEISAQAGQIFGFVGKPYSGKTTQALTFPRPLLVLTAERKTRAALLNAAGSAVDGIEVEEFIPDAVPLNAGVGAGDVKDAEAAGAAAATHQRLIDYLRKAKKDKESPYSKAATILWDSGTSWASIFLDLSVDALGHRSTGAQIGKQEVNDYTKAGRTFLAVARELQSTGKHLVIPIHTAEIRNDKGDVTRIGLSLPGGAKAVLPTLLDHTFFLTREVEKQQVRFKAQTRPAGLVQDAGTAWKGLEVQLDVTIEDFSKPQNYGLGKLLAGAR